MEGRSIRATRVAVLAFLGVMVGAVAAVAERPVGRIETPRSCKEYAPPPKQALGKTVGIEECVISDEEVVFNIAGHKYRRVEIRISGTVDGWAMKEKGPQYNYLNDGPEFVFVQSGHTGKPFRGIARYEASRGSGMTIFYPEDPKEWNGKLFVTAHGAGPYQQVGTLIPRDPNLNFNPWAGINRYVGLMVDKGYAVAHTMRSSWFKGDLTVVLEDGTTVMNYNVSSHAGLILSWTKLAKNFLQKELGQKPQLTYWYGFSAGGFLGRLINYKPGVNKDDDGKPIIDGFLIDDSGGGMWLPKLIVDGKDVLFTTYEDRKRFVKQIDITHQLYAGRRTEDYLDKKRENASLLKEKGLGDKHRMYEIRGVSHFDPGQVGREDLMFQNLDLTGVIDAFIDLLDGWVVKGIAPPSTRSDLTALGDADGDGRVENPAVALPEIACPLGIYHTFPKALGKTPRGTQTTAFAAFDGTNLEPLDGRGIFVDMNGNGIRDKRETVTQAWTRLGLLKQEQKFDRSKYVSCVANAVSGLVDNGLLPPNVGVYYLEQAARRRIPDE